MNWIVMHPEVNLGLLPNFLSEDDPRSAKEQLNENYAHGGGWLPMEGFKLTSRGRLSYPGDPPLRALAVTKLRHEAIVLFEHEFVAIIQPDGTFEVARMD